MTAGVSLPGADSFLAALWGAAPDGTLDGVHFIAEPTPNGWRHYRVKNIPEALAKAGEISKAGRNAYFACAGFIQESYRDQEGKRRFRTAENARGARDFWLDIDCGEAKAAKGEGYATQKAGLAALIKFCAAVGLPEPSIVVDSGNGLHCYWHFSEFINRETWRAIARKLKALAAKHGLIADPSRTADIASVLRVPGTMNWKDPGNPKPVTIRQFTAPVAFSAFVAALDVAMPDGEGLGTPPANVGAMLGANIDQRALSPETPEEIARVRAMLATIPAGCDRDSWRNLVWAVLATGWTCAEDLAREWSMTAPTLYDEADFDKVVTSYKPDGGIGYGTLVHMAKAAGWVDQRQGAEVVDGEKQGIEGDGGRVKAA